MITTWIEISKKALLNNVAEVRKILKPHVKFMAVVKSNAYGHGLWEVVSVIKNKVDYLAVFSLEDALFLRKKNIKNPILVLGRIFEDQIDLAIKNNIEVTISTFDILKNCRKKLKAHICVDTGLGRDGFLADDLEKVAKILKNSPIEVVGIYGHFAAADDENRNDYSKTQIQNLLRWKAKFPRAMVHHDSSAGVINSSISEHFDLARIGIGIYGFYPSPKMKNRLKLQPVLKWLTKISEIKNQKKGAKISYNCTYELQRDSRTALLPIGYYDGISRVSSNKGFVTIKGKKAAQLGRVTMNLLIVDVTEIPGAKIGDVVEIIGPKTSAEDWAVWSQTSAYEVVTRLNSSIKRIIK